MPQALISLPITHPRQSPHANCHEMSLPQWHPQKELIPGGDFHDIYPTMEFTDISLDAESVGFGLVQAQAQMNRVFNSQNIYSFYGVPLWNLKYRRWTKSIGAWEDRTYTWRKQVSWTVIALTRQIWPEIYHLSLRKLIYQDHCCHEPFITSLTAAQSIQVQNMFEDVLKTSSEVPVPKDHAGSYSSLLKSQGHVPKNITRHQKVQ